ncbi:hypothetical protein, conserved [Leishmania donovani]|uniref:RNA binding protein, putative n=1 Tax=Leishmania donovani TaxID=5661 RepID=E9BH48_LEIDO|nr:hypothetical protein, conserved [Leishmania donovani]AYU79269.1 RNA binding protein, putative [Leishmania donovani]CBZ34574.1 hypothetical protein, conserved [Leishmania donovani]
MDSDLSAEIARIEAELAQDAELRQQQQQQQQQLAPQLSQQPPASLFGFGQTAPAQPQQQQQQLFHTQPPQPQQQPSNPFNVNASPFMPTPQQPDYSQQQQQQQQPIGSAGQAAAQACAPTPIIHSFSKDTDSRSIFIGNLPRGTDGTPATTPEELVQFFADCGNILNCTVLKDRATGEPKGTAYIEFADYTAMGKAIDTKNNANFKGSTIIVCVSTSPIFYLQVSSVKLLKPMQRPRAWRGCA